LVLALARQGAAQVDGPVPARDAELLPVDALVGPNLLAQHLLDLAVGEESEVVRQRRLAWLGRGLAFERGWRRRRALDAVQRRGKRAQSRDRDRCPATRARAVAALRQPPQRRVDLLDLALPAIVQPRRHAGAALRLCSLLDLALTLAGNELELALGGGDVLEERSALPSQHDGELLAFLGGRHRRSLLLGAVSARPSRMTMPFSTRMEMSPRAPADSRTGAVREQRVTQAVADLAIAHVLHRRDPQPVDDPRDRRVRRRAREQQLLHRNAVDLALEHHGPGIDPDVDVAPTVEPMLASNGGLHVGEYALRVHDRRALQRSCQRPE
jgi:hypothetical protein